VLSVLRSADSACDTAKEAGRDRMHVLEPGDSTLEKRRDIMSFVSQIDNALKEDWFVLNCQKIQPINEDGEDHPHYEILLTVLDENNEPMPPQDFIEFVLEQFHEARLPTSKICFEWSSCRK
jgi:hypothetical protein